MDPACSYTADMILVEAIAACIRATNQPWDEADRGAIILASARYYLQHGQRHPALTKSTTEIY